MRLQRVEISGFKSIKRSVELFLEPDVTVIVGANDHGKSNLLRALQALNQDFSAQPDDISWDASDEDRSELPLFRFTFRLENDHELRQVADAQRAGEATGGAEGSDDAFPGLHAIPDLVTLQLSGVGRKELWDTKGQPLAPEAIAAITLLIPRVEMVVPFSKVSDSVTFAELATNEFMQGIFYYAGLEPNEKASAALFEQGDRSTRQLKVASLKLTEELRRNWSQGRDLEFFLQHDSARKAIDLRINDPAVSAQPVQASRRSSGFGHFFALKTILHARARRYPARSRVWVFDEPGIYLHPAGQYDLLREMERIGRDNQVVYSTHSPFLLSRTFPGRHRLVLKDGNGTQLDRKPHRNSWAPMLNALGLSLVGSLLFARFVLLVEGDSDPVYIWAVLQDAVARGTFRSDLNGLAIVAVSDTDKADDFIRIFRGMGPHPPRIAALFDGDEGGKSRADALRSRDSDVRVDNLAEGTEIEDCLPGGCKSYVLAASQFVRKAFKDSPSLDESLRQLESLAGDVAPGISKRVSEVAMKALKRQGKLSKLGIAREYELLLAESRGSMDSETSRGLLDKIQSLLDLPDVDEIAEDVTR